MITSLAVKQVSVSSSYATPKASFVFASELVSSDFMHRNVEVYVWVENGRFGVGTVCLGALPPHLTRSMGSQCVCHSWRDTDAPTPGVHV